MKKIISLLILATIITVMAGTASAGSEKLIAGQFTDIGYVTVWNDESTLFVVFNTVPSGWIITETHLHVATSFDDIPVNKKGSPTPGKFQYSDEDAIWLYNDQKAMFPIPLTWEPGTVLYIAAHAVVEQVDEFGNVVREETAWGTSRCETHGDHYLFPGNKWATYFLHTVK